MLVERHLLRETITYSEAKDIEVNILHQLGYWSQQNAFFSFMRVRRSLIETQVARHLRVHPTKCHAADVDDWVQGSFNLGIPVTVEGFGRVIIRFPLPYRVGEGFFPGNSDEKVKCEAGTYAWMQQHCPTVPIPRLHGFALSTGQRFTALEHLPLFYRLAHRLKSLYFSLVGLPVPSQFVRDKPVVGNELGPYLIVDLIEEGEILSTSWAQLRGQNNFRKTLFRDLSKIMLAMSKVALPKIGSFIIDDDGYLRLANRPLTLMSHDLENENIPVNMRRDQTFASVDSYVDNLLTCHDNRLYFQPNAVNNHSDCISQMTALGLMRTVRPQFFSKQLNHGPFVFSLTELHPSNILVDKDWHIKCLVDLEWACSLPIEFMRPPIWLTSQAVDEIDMEDYNDLRNEFMLVFEEEERHCSGEYNAQRTSIMQRVWQMGTFWYSAALRSPTGFHSIFYDRIQPLYSETHALDPNLYLIVSRYWARGVLGFIKSKLDDKADYDRRLYDAFHES